MQVLLLGNVALDIGGRIAEIRPPQLRSLLARLAVGAGGVVSTEAIAADVLGDDDDARNSVKTYVSRLRKDLARLGAPDLVRTVAPGYSLRVEREAVDCYRFEGLVRHGRAAFDDAQYEEAERVLDEALGLWRGTPFSDVADRPFVHLERIRLEELRLLAVETRHDLAIATGDAAAVVPALEVLVRQHPLREHFWAQLMRALYQTGRQAAALRAYQDARRVLVEELGVEPGHELRDLERTVIAQERPATPNGRVPNERAPLGQSTTAVLLVDDHPMWRETVRAVLSRAADIDVVAEAGTADEAVERARESHPDLVLMDLHLPDGTGASATARILHDSSASKVLMLSGSDAAPDVIGAVRAGAVGYVVKSAGPAELTDAVRRAAAGEVVFTGALADLVLNEFRSMSPGARPADGDTAILGLVAQGSSVEAIAEKLHLDEAQVRDALGRVVQRLQVVEGSTAPPAKP